jgi:hypothetical protein
MPMPGRVFISYSSVDREQVQGLAKALDEVPIPYFLDQKEIQWGDDINDKIGRGLAECFALIVVLSPASVKSQWVPFEIGQAVGLDKRVLPFLTHPSVEIPAFLQKFHYETSIEGVTSFFRSAHTTLASAVEADVGNPSRPLVLIDRYYSEIIEAEEDDQRYLLEKVGIVNRGNATAVNIVIPEIRFAGRWTRALIPLATLGPGESVDVEISNLKETLDHVHTKVRESGLQAQKGGPWFLCLRLVVEYRDLSHKSWATEQTLQYSAFGISFAIINPNEPQQWLDLTTLEKRL